MENEQLAEEIDFDNMVSNNSKCPKSPTTEEPEELSIQTDLIETKHLPSNNGNGKDPEETSLSFEVGVKTDNTSLENFTSSKRQILLEEVEECEKGTEVDDDLSILPFQPLLKQNEKISIEEKTEPEPRQTPSSAFDGCSNYSKKEIEKTNQEISIEEKTGPEPQNDSSAYSNPKEIEKIGDEDTSIGEEFEAKSQTLPSNNIDGDSNELQTRQTIGETSLPKPVRASLRQKKIKNVDDPFVSVISTLTRR